MPILLAISAAVCFAAGGVTAKRGIVHNNVSLALLISLPVTIAVTGIFTLFDPPGTITLAAIVLFALAGLAGDGLGRGSFVMAVDHLGPSTATPIQTGSYPVIALIVGIAVFSEDVTLGRVAGAAFIVAGIWVLMGFGPKSGTDEAGGAPSRSSRWVYLIPVIGGVAFALADTMRKLGLEEAPNPAFGATIAATTVLIVWLVAAIATPAVRRTLNPGPGWQWFLVMGVFIGLGVVSGFGALQSGDITVVGPIVLAQPLIVVALSALFLRDLERVTWNMVVGALLTVVGVIVLSLS